MRSYIYIIFCLLLTANACTNTENKTNNHPFLLDFKIGESKESWQKKLNDHLQNDTLRNPCEDSIFYERPFYFKGEKFNLDYSFNNDGYSEEELQIIRIYLTTDTIERWGSKRYARNKGSSNMQAVDTCRVLLHELFGEPHATFPFDLKNDRLIIEEVNQLNQSVLNFKKYHSPFELQLWNFDNYSIQFAPSFSDARIEFIAPGYNNNLDQIIENRRKLLRPNDIMEIEMGQPTWENKFNEKGQNKGIQINIPLSKIFRHGREEQRDVIGINMNVHVMDIFGDTLLTIPNVKHQFETPYTAQDADAFLQRVQHPKLILEHHYPINTEYTTFQKVKFLREFCKKNNVTVKAEMISIVFADGEVLR